MTLPPVPPRLPGLQWRPLHPVDLSALRQMLDECVLLDGPHQPQERTVANIETDTLAALGTGGRVAAYAWLMAPVRDEQGLRVLLDGRVHPDYRGRGLGRFLLGWAVARAQAVATETDVTVYLQITCPRAAYAPTLARAGFRPASPVAGTFEKTISRLSR